MSYVLSPTSLKLFRECPRCFWRHFNEGVKRPNGIFPSLPSGMDGVLKVHFDTFMKKSKLSPELHTLSHMQLFDNEEQLSVWRNYWKGIRWTDQNGNVIYGAIDNLLTHKGKFVVIDYKTRGYPLKEDTHEYYQDQLNIYTFLLKENGYDTESFAYLLFYHPNKVMPDGGIQLHSELKKVEVSIHNAEKLINDAIETLQGDCPATD